MAGCTLHMRHRELDRLSDHSLEVDSICPHGLIGVEQSQSQFHLLSGENGTHAPEDTPREADLIEFSHLDRLIVIEA